MRWFGPYKVLKFYANGSVKLQDFAGNLHATRYNGYKLKRMNLRASYKIKRGTTHLIK